MKKTTKARQKVKRLTSAELEVLIRTAALKLDPKGSLNPLAAKAGVTTETIRAAIRVARFTAGLACALECAVGASVLPKETLCPEKFCK